MGGRSDAEEWCFAHGRKPGGGGISRGTATAWGEGGISRGIQPHFLVEGGFHRGLEGPEKIVISKMWQLLTVALWANHWAATGLQAPKPFREIGSWRLRNL